MIFTTKIQVGEDESKSFFSEIKYIVHFYHDRNNNGNRTCKCQIKEFETKRELVSVEVACDSRDNYVKAVGRKLSLLKAYHTLRDEGYPVDSNWITSMLKQLNEQAPHGMELAVGVNYKVEKNPKIKPSQGSKKIGDHWINTWTPKAGDIIKVGNVLYRYDPESGFVFHSMEDYHGKVDCNKER